MSSKLLASFESFVCSSSSPRFPGGLINLHQDQLIPRGHRGIWATLTAITGRGKFSNLTKCLKRVSRIYC